MSWAALQRIPKPAERPLGSERGLQFFALSERSSCKVLSQVLITLILFLKLIWF